MHYKCVTEQLKIERTCETKEHWKTEPENHQQVWIWIPKIKKLEYFNCQLLFNLKIITGMQKKKNLQSTSNGTFGTTVYSFKS